MAYKISKFIALFLLCAICASAQTRSTIQKALETPVSHFVVASPRPVGDVFDTLSRSYGIPIIMDSDVSGEVSFRVTGTRLRGLLDAICRPHGWHYEIDGSEGDSYIIVHRFVTKVYSVDYLQLSQTMSSSASVNISASNSNNSGSSSSSYRRSGNSNNSEGNGSGDSSVSLTSESEADFWGRFEEDAKAFVGKDERLVINRFAGLVQLTASLRTHAEVETYINQVMKRVRRSVVIAVRLVRVDLADSQKMGVDWSIAAFSIGKGGNAPVVGGSFTGINGETGSGTGSLTTNLGDVGGVTLPGETFRAVIASGKVSALISALKEQGDVTVTNRSTVSALNNQMALMQISEDRPVFSKESQTTYNQATTGVTPTTETNYSKETISFGNVLEVTPQVDDQLVTTLSVSPTITDFRGNVTSPDGGSTAYNVGVKRYRSTVVLRNGETAILGGFIEETSGTTSRGVPFLSAIPGIGGLFRTDGKISRRSELAILISVEAEDPLLPSPRRVDLPAPDQSLSPEVMRAISKDGIQGREPTAEKDEATGTPKEEQPHKVQIVES